MGRIFISYRREDSGPITGRIFDCLLAHFGPGSVSMDIDSIPFGVDFRQHISDEVSRCEVVLAIIGDQWLDSRQNDQRRLDNPHDFVRIELEAALTRGIPVVPVVVGKASIPPADSLPQPLKDLAYRNAAPVDNFRDFHPHMDRLIRDLEKHFQGLRPGANAATAGTLAQLWRFCHRSERIRDAGAVALVFAVLGFLWCMVSMVGVITGKLAANPGDRPAEARETLITQIAMALLTCWAGLTALTRKPDTLLAVGFSIWAITLMSFGTLVFDVALLAGLDFDAGGLLKEPVVKFIFVTIQTSVAVVCLLLCILALIAFHRHKAGEEKGTRTD